MEGPDDAAFVDGETLAAVPRGTQPVEADAAEDDRIPERIGRYRVQGGIGEGGMGIVVRAHDPELSRDVALKLVRASWRGRSEAARSRSLREAQALAQLSHPNVVRVFDVGVQHDRMYIAMEFLQGRTLAELQLGDPPWRETLARYVAAGEALAAAHAEGIVHRDFKPDNVMLTEEGQIKVLDFGLARLAGDASPPPSDAEPQSEEERLHASHSAFDMALTTPGTFVGTPAFMAPEQFDGKAITPKTDQFSFCVSLWQALYRQRPFPGRSLPDLRRAIRHGEITPPQGSEVPKSIRRALRTGLHEDPSQRHPSMTTLLRALRPGAGGSRTWGLLLAGSAAVAVGLTVWSAAAPPDPCTGAQAALARTWDDTRRASTQSAVLGSSHAFANSTWRHLQPRLDAWAVRWVDAHEAICRAAQVEQTRDASALDSRMACLERSRLAADAFLEVLSGGARDAVRLAIRNAAALPDPSVCTTQDAEAPRQVAPAVQQRIAALQQRLLEARARGDAGDLGMGIELALSIAREAAEWGATELRLDAMLLEADYRTARGERHAAHASLREAYLEAVEADDAARAGRAARALVFVTGVELAHYDEALSWHRHARAHLDRLPEPDPLAEAALLSNLGAVQGVTGDLAASTKSQLQALELERATLPADDLAMVPTLSNVANALANEGRAIEAVEYARSAATISRSSLGAEHPDAIAALEALASVLRTAGNCTDAVVVSNEALEGAAASFGTSHIAYARNLLALAQCSEALEDPGDARAFADSALLIFREELDEAHPDLAAALDVVGSLAAQAKDDAGSIAAQREALAIQERLDGPDHVRVAQRLINLGTSERRSGALADAIARYQRAAEIADADLADADLDAVAHENLALALREAERWEEADTHYRAAIAAMDDDAELRRTAAVSARAEVLLQLGRATEALPLLEQARRRCAEAAGTPGSAATGARTDVRLAAALLATGGDASRAVALASAARVELMALGDAPAAAAAQALILDAPP
ncbi:MAG: serine/threonine-protein kinase [Myxococcota bacterium]